MAAKESKARDGEHITNPNGTLGVTGVTMNAMALIAPGAFLWMTFQLQAAQVGPDGKTGTGYDMWQGVVFALIVAFLTAIAYAQLAKIYPDAGYGSAYYFAEKAFLDKEDAKHHKIARLSKLITGWAAHLFYWVYPGVMVAFMAILISYLCGLFGMKTADGPGLSIPMQMVVAVLFAIAVGFIAVRGVSGSTMTSIVVNIIQWVTLIFFSILAIIYRLKNPDHANFVMHGGSQIGHPSAASIFIPHSMPAVLFQSSIAILILVGFESCTAFGADAKNPKHSIPKGVIWSLAIQGLAAYLLEYFAANFGGLSDKLTYTSTVDGKEVISYGMDAAAKSQAPIGDMMRVFGDSLLHGIGFGLAVTMAVTVALAILGTTLSCLNTGVRVSYAMAKDKEMPELIGLMHGKFATPSAATWILTAFSALVGCVGVYSLVYLTGIGIASNLGTFILYMLICIWTIVGFSHRPDRNIVLHVLIPILGLFANALMIGTIFYLAFASGGDAAKEGLIAIKFAAVWAAVSIIYVLVTGPKKSEGQGQSAQAALGTS